MKLLNQNLNKFLLTVLGCILVFSNENLHADDNKIEDKESSEASEQKKDKKNEKKEFKNCKNRQK